MSSYTNCFAKFLAGLIVVFLSHASYANGVAGKLENEKPVSGVVTGTGVDSYSFQIAAGSSFQVNVSETGNHVDHFSPSLKLIGPDKQVKNEWSQELFARLAGMSAQGGEWKIEVSRHDAGAGGGSYKIELLQAPGVKGKPMEFTKTYTGAIIRGAADVYTISATPGVKEHLNLTPRVAGLILAANVYSPGGEVIAANDCRDTCNIDVEMKQPGTYTAMIWRDDPTDNKGAYAVALLPGSGSGPIVVPPSPSPPVNAAAGGRPPPANAGTLLEQGKQYTGSITGGAVDVFNLDGNQSMMMMVELTLAPQGFSPLVTAFGPDGELVGTERCSETCHLDLPPLRPGTTKVMVWRKDEDGPKGAYTLSILNGMTREGRPLSLLPRNPGNPSTVSPFAHEVPSTMAAALGPKKIENGKPVNGTIKGRKTDSYTFTASKGSSFMASLIKKGAQAGGFDLQMLFFGPDNRQALGQGGTRPNRMLWFGAKEGAWRIEVGQFNSAGEASGEYELNLLQIPGATGPPLEFGKSYNGTISRGRFDVYTINGTPGVTAQLTLTATSRAGFMPRADIFASNGANAGGVGCVDRCTTEVAMTDYGAYTVAVSRDDEQDKKGAYSLFVKRKGDKEEPPPLTAESVYRNAAETVWPEDTAAMRRQAEIYINGQFLIFSPLYPPSDDRRAAEGGDVLKQISWGDSEAWTVGPDPRAGITWWKKAADQGNSDARNRLAIAGAVDSSGKKYEAAAWYRLVVGQAAPDPDISTANMYLTGSGQGQDLKQAEKLYKAVAERGVAQAQFNLGVLYTLGIGGKENYPEAAKWYAKAAAQGLVVAENNLAELYEHGQGVPQDDKQAAAWYQKAAEAGYPLAQYHLATLAAEGRGMAKDEAKAAEWLKKAADSGNAEAQAELDVLQGKGAEAMRYWKKTAASGDRVSLRKLVETARKTGIDPADYDDMLATYRIAAKEVNPEAFLGLADLFAKQKPPDDFEAYFWHSLAVDTAKTAPLPPDEREAVTAYAAAEAARIAKKLSPEQVAVTKWRIKDRTPQPLSKAQEAAAPVILRAQKLREAGDEEDAVMFFIQAAHLGVPRGWSNVCYMYEYGAEGLGQDINKALDYCKKAIRGGLVDAATTIGDMYMFGIGVSVDYEEAARWYEMDDSRGSRDARNRLGWLFLQGIPGSGKRAVAMYEKSAAKGEMDAYDALGMIYLYGLAGIQRDISQALKWYLKAADRSDDVGSVQAAAILKDREPHDYERALKLINTIGGPVAMNNVAFMFENGLGVAGQASMGGYANMTAMELYKKAADMCYGRAMYNIGRLYETGANSPAVSATPVKADPAQARQWMERAADNGSVAAAIWLESRDPDTIRSDKIPKEEAGYPPEPCPKPEKKESEKQ